MNSKNTYIMNLIKGCLALYFIFSLFNVSAQNENHPFVKNFKAEAIEGRVFLSWTTKAGFTCQDIHIQLSGDSVDYFETKGTYFGICGDATEKDYSFILENPIYNSLNYLKLELGSYGYSYTISVRVIKAGNNVLVVPHPVAANSILHFQNPLHERVQLDFYDRTGQLILTVESIDNKIAIGELSLPIGIVFYYLRGSGTLNKRGRLVIGSRS
jgi:hypothetical protein